MEELKETEEELEEIKEKVSSSTDELNDTYNDLDTIKVKVKGLSSELNKVQKWVRKKQENLLM
jgi:predicted phage-related endonuclease